MSDKRPNPLTATASSHQVFKNLLLRGPLFITGTDTEVGKTYVAAELLRVFRESGRRVAPYKPVATGCNRDATGTLTSDDALALWQAAGRPEQLERVCPQRFEQPLAPPAAAAAEGKAVDSQRLIDGARWWMDRYEGIVVEGAGGLMSPLADNCFNADLALQLGASLIVVAANRLGTINHTLLTIIAARSRGLNVLGVILNQITAEPDASASTNAAAIERYAGVPLLATVPYRGRLVSATA